MKACHPQPQLVRSGRRSGTSRNISWSTSEEHIEIIIDYKNMRDIDEGSVQPLSCELTFEHDRSFSCVVKMDGSDEGKGADHRLKVDTLLHAVETGKSKCRLNKEKKKVTIKLIKVLKQKWASLK